jgi:hypothetical protein
VDNIRMDLGEVGWDDVDWIDLAQDRNRWRALVNSVLKLQVPLNAGKLSSGLTSSGLSISVQLHRERERVITFAGNQHRQLLVFAYLTPLSSEVNSHIL